MRIDERVRDRLRVRVRLRVKVRIRGGDREGNGYREWEEEKVERGEVGVREDRKEDEKGEGEKSWSKIGRREEQAKEKREGKGAG